MVYCLSWGNMGEIMIKDNKSNAIIFIDEKQLSKTLRRDNYVIKTILLLIARITWKKFLND